MSLLRKALMCCTIFLVSHTSIASDSSGWEYEITPYLLAAAMKGTVGANGVTTDVDVSFSDILKNLDSGFMGLFTAQKDPWFLGLELVHMKLEGENSGTVTGPGGRVSVNGKLELTNTLNIIQGSVGYRILDTTTLLHLIGALRHTKLEAGADITLQFTPGILLTGGSRSAQGSQSWTDAIIGLQALQKLSDQFSLVGYFDIGTGGSDLTYQVIAGLNWQYSQTFSMKLGYRYLYWDYKKDGIVWDMAARGPYLGLGIKF